MLSDNITAIIRTLVPGLVGACVSYFASKGINIDEAQAAQLAGFLTFALSGIYYIVVRGLEAKYPKAGWLLGVAKKPTY